ncbi:MAG: hypothetical protein QOJ59_2496 [Thermomicrobiales bacterium]|jgi:hypothetical protein|nr:hypothetical protein [Thermomicrobiales bacterium]
MLTRSPASLLVDSNVEHVRKTVQRVRQTGSDRVHGGDRLKQNQRPGARAVRFRPAETGSSGSGAAEAERAATSASIIGANNARPSP